MPATCRSCDAPILWAITAKNRRIPLDPEPVDRTAEHGVGLFVVTHNTGVLHAHSDNSEMPSELSRYKSHFATCPNATEHRR